MSELALLYNTLYNYIQIHRLQLLGVRPKPIAGQTER